MPKTRFIRLITPPCLVILFINALAAVKRFSVDDETLAMRKISAPKEKIEHVRRDITAQERHTDDRKRKGISLIKQRS